MRALVPFVYPKAWSCHYTLMVVIKFMHYAVRIDRKSTYNYRKLRILADGNTPNLPGFSWQIVRLEIEIKYKLAGGGFPDTIQGWEGVWREGNWIFNFFNNFLYRIKLFKYTAPVGGLSPQLPPKTKKPTKIDCF